MNAGQPVRIGVLGAAAPAAAAVIQPAHELGLARIHAVAARERERADKYAIRHKIAHVHENYAELLGDPEVDAVYIPLPNALHGQWALAAIKAGKHVLCEKPFTANSAQAREVAAAAADSGLVVTEAMHYRYHPLLTRALDVLESGELGAIKSISVSACLPEPRFAHRNYQYEFGGGALMAIGCYAADLVRVLGNTAKLGEPEVISARARTLRKEVDRTVRARLHFSSGTTAKLHASLCSSTLLKLVAHVRGEHGEMRIINPMFPQMGHQLAVRIGGDRRVEHFTRRSSHAFQLGAFTSAIRARNGVGSSHPTPVIPLAESVATMAMIDNIYQAANLSPRKPA